MTKEQENNIQKTIKVEIALCKITGMTEARAQWLRDQGRLEEALDEYNNLIYVHETLPLLNSEAWCKEYAETIKNIKREIIHHTSMKLA